MNINIPSFDMSSFATEIKEKQTKRNNNSNPNNTKSSSTNISYNNTIDEMMLKQTNYTNERHEKTQSLTISTDKGLPFVKMGSELISFNDEEEKNVFLLLVNNQKELQKALSKYNQTDNNFIYIKKKLKEVGKEISYYKQRPKPIHPVLITTPGYSSQNNIGFETQIDKKNTNFDQLLKDSKTLYELCCYVCKNVKEDVDDLYTILTKNYDFIMNDRSIIRLRTELNEIYTLRLINSDKYNDFELNLIKEKIFYEYNNFKYNVLKK